MPEENQPSGYLTRTRAYRTCLAGRRHVLPRPHQQ